MDTNAAASYLTLRPATMRVWRSQGKGPNYKLVGGRLVRYHRDDLDAFARGEVQR
ncbi:helix-turn-helix domain-containing protein [Albimonas sp. CAU 1670]|nr:helix-turn-helix domain-containing protein [Albimonas sp. CAU 1670]MDF2231589.1 helix-turn-helix domain-containing protein [Albimonas sp. CAU 1670]